MPFTSTWNHLLQTFCRSAEATRSFGRPTYCSEPPKERVGSLPKPRPMVIPGMREKENGENGRQLAQKKWIKVYYSHSRADEKA